MFCFFSVNFKDSSCVFWTALFLKTLLRNQYALLLLSFTAVADTTTVDPSTESAAPDPVNSEDKPKEDAVEQSPPPPAEPSVDMKTGDEGTVSNNTSVELLKETNENNSNNAYISQQRGW